ncbi:MAG: hypothetical protein JRJ03_10940 [Deltaproteobacteria bacterium]|nr:hypothetical protein [Deltaproteobacteria bacterium]
MEHWGAPFEKDDKGNLLRKPGRGHNEAVVFPGLELMDFIRKRVEASGVLPLDHPMVTDLIRTQEGISGAVGFHIREHLA